MSTKSSLSLINWAEPHEIHIYHECMDGCYYIETNEGKLKLPKEIAKLYAKVTKDIEKNQDKKRDQELGLIDHEEK